MRSTLVPALALAVCGALLSGCGNEQAPTTDPSPVAATPSGPPPTEAPTEAPTEVPADFPLAAGLPRVNGDDGTPVEVTDRPGWTSVELCGETAWSTEAPVAASDVAGAAYRGEAEDSRARLLAVYDDADEAQTSLGALRAAYQACPAGEVGGTDQVYEVVEVEDGSVTLTHRYRTEGRFDTGLEVIELVAVGNALLVTAYYGEGGGSAETIASQVGSAHDGTRPVVAAMRDSFAG